MLEHNIVFKFLLIELKSILKTGAATTLYMNTELKVRLFLA